MAKRANSWLQEWSQGIQGGLVHLDERIENLRAELVKLETLRRRVTGLMDAVRPTQKTVKTHRPVRPQKQTSTLSGYEVKVLDALRKEEKYISASALAAQIGIRPDGIYRLLHKLNQRHLIQKVRSGHSLRWKAKKQE